jgi:zinc and cadmium transporter
MSPVALLAVYCLLILAASLAGGWIPLVVRLTHQRMQLAVSLVGGLMLGVGLLDMLPHSLEVSGSPNTTTFWTLVGFLTMFFIERFLCFHHHDAPGEESHSATEHSPACNHVLDESHRLTWSGAAVGLSLHSVLNGVALGASVQAEWSEGSRGLLLGLGTFLAVFLHKPFDSMTLGTLMAVGGWSRRSRHLVNFLFALAIPVGVTLFQLGLGSLAGEENRVVAYALAFSAGTFLCISTSDLLPELQFHQHDRVKLSTALLAGLVLAWAIGLAEKAGHEHGSTPGAPHQEEQGFGDQGAGVLEDRSAGVPPALVSGKRGSHRAVRQFSVFRIRRNNTLPCENHA